VSLSAVLGVLGARVMTNPTLCGAPPPPPRSRENPDAGALLGWPIGYLSGPSVWLISQVPGLPEPRGRAVFGLVCFAVGAVLLGMVLLPVGLVGGRTAMWLRNRRAAAWPAFATGFVGSLAAGMAFGLGGFLLWAVCRSL
ncbi:MAG: hypothetical protein AAF907_02955, partial [Planctomycetota bacterium]